MWFLIFSGLLIFLILIIFFLLSKKVELENLGPSIFECGFSSYYFSRFSFSIHYFFIGLIFLLLDLELCYAMPFFNTSFSSMKMIFFLIFFLFILLLGLVGEWKSGVLDWKN